MNRTIQQLIEEEIAAILRDPSTSFPNGAEQRVREMLKEKGVWAKRAAVVVNSRLVSVTGTSVGDFNVPVPGLPRPSMMGVISTAEAGDRSYDIDDDGPNNTTNFAFKIKFG